MIAVQKIVQQLVCTRNVFFRFILFFQNKSYDCIHLWHNKLDKCLRGDITLWKLFFRQCFLKHFSNVSIYFDIISRFDLYLIHTVVVFSFTEWFQTTKFEMHSDANRGSQHSISLVWVKVLTFRSNQIRSIGAYWIENRFYLKRKSFGVTSN